MNKKRCKGTTKSDELKAKLILQTPHAKNMFGCWAGKSGQVLNFYEEQWQTVCFF